MDNKPTFPATLARRKPPIHHNILVVQNLIVRTILDRHTVHNTLFPGILNKHNPDQSQTQPRHDMKNKRVVLIAPLFKQHLTLPRANLVESLNTNNRRTAKNLVDRVSNCGPTNLERLAQRNIRLPIVSLGRATTTKHAVNILIKHVQLVNPLLAASPFFVYKIANLTVPILLGLFLFLLIVIFSH